MLLQTAQRVQSIDCAPYRPLDPLCLQQACWHPIFTNLRPPFLVVSCTSKKKNSDLFHDVNAGEIDKEQVVHVNRLKPCFVNCNMKKRIEKWKFLSQSYVNLTSAALIGPNLFNCLAEFEPEKNGPLFISVKQLVLQREREKCDCLIFLLSGGGYPRRL